MPATVAGAEARLDAELAAVYLRREFRAWAAAGDSWRGRETHARLRLRALTVIAGTSPPRALRRLSALVEHPFQGDGMI